MQQAQRVLKPNNPEMLIQEYRLKAEIMSLDPPLYLNVDVIDDNLLDCIESSACAKTQIEADHKKWQENRMKLTLHKKTTLEAPPNRPRARPKAGKDDVKGSDQHSYKKKKHSSIHFDKSGLKLSLANGGYRTTQRKRQEEDDAKYAREL